MDIELSSELAYVRAAVRRRKGRLVEMWTEVFETDAGENRWSTIIFLRVRWPFAPGDPGDGEDSQPTGSRLASENAI